MTTGGIDVGGTSGNNPPATQNPPTTQTTTTTSSSSSSTPSAPPVDPVVAEKESLFKSIYLSLWGEPPTQDYIMAAAKSGMNSYEFEQHERAKPAFAQTPTYAKEVDALVGSYDFLQVFKRGGGGRKKGGGGNGGNGPNGVPDQGHAGFPGGPHGGPRTYNGPWGGPENGRPNPPRQNLEGGPTSG